MGKADWLSKAIQILIDRNLISPPQKHQQENQQHLLHTPIDLVK